MSVIQLANYRRAPPVLPRDTTTRAIVALCEAHGLTLDQTARVFIDLEREGFEA